MSDRAISHRADCATRFRAWVCTRVRQVMPAVRDLYAGLKRLNGGGEWCVAYSSNSRSRQIKAFKEMLARRYRDHSRCC
jgi:hypothetical protein